MKKGIITILCFFILAVFFVFGCTKTNPTEPDPQPQPSITPTVTPLPTSTPAVSPNLSGTVTFPADAVGKQFAVVVDTDTNTANGNTAVFYGTINSVNEDYAFEVAAGTYYIYAFVDMNGSGLFDGPGGFDYFGAWNSWSSTMPIATGLNFNCSQIIDPVITVNFSIPADAAGRGYFAGLLAGNTIETVGSPVSGTDGILGAGTQFTFSFNYTGETGGPYYLVCFVDSNGNMQQIGGPDEGDYLKVYGAAGINWPASKNFTVTGDMTVTLTLETIVPNVTGTLTLPGPANNNNYLIAVTNLPLNEESSPDMMMLTKTAQAGAGNTINYGIFVPFPGDYYITAVVDMDGSGWDNIDSGPVSVGDFIGAYGLAPPIINWQNPFPQQPNAALPGTGFNIACTTFPDLSQPYEMPTPAPTPDTAVVGEGTVSGTVTLPAGQNGKTLNIMIDMDLDPTNDNSVGMYQVDISSGTSITYTVQNVPAGTYYIYAGATNDTPPMTGDAVGVYGATYPSFPASANAVVTSGGTLTANITAVAAAPNFSGRVYLPESVTIGRNWGVVIDHDMDGGNENSIGMTIGVINTSQNYFDYSMVLALPGTYFVYAIVDSAEPYDMFTNGPGCNDLIGFYSVPMPVYFTPWGNNTNININTSLLYQACP